MNVEKGMMAGDERKDGQDVTGRGDAAVGGEAVAGTNAAATAQAPTAKKMVGGGFYDLADLTVEMPGLRERRHGAAKDNLASRVTPVITTADGERLDVRKGRDFTLAFYRDRGPGDGASDEPLAKVCDAGSYHVVVTGISRRLHGTTTATLTVRKPSRRPLVALAVLLVALVAAGAYLHLNPTEAPWYDPMAGDGLAGVHGDELQALLDAKVAEGTMNITILDSIYFPQGATHPGEAGFNNLAANHFDQRLTITLDDTGEVVYESGAIRPGQNIQYITLNRELDPGTYAATASVTGYDPQTHEAEGTLNALVELVVADA